MVHGKRTMAHRMRTKMHRKNTNKGIVVVCLVIAAMIFTLTACGGSGGRNSSGGSRDNDVTGDAHTAFIAAMMQIMDDGAELADEGYFVQAQSHYAFAASSLSSLRYAIEYILWLKGEGESITDVTEGSVNAGWDEIAAICYASPYPYYFEGLLWQVQGEDDKADFYYGAALQNPAYPDEDVIFYYLRDMEVDELYKLRDEIREKELEVYSLLVLGSSTLPRDVLCYDPGYLVTGMQEAVSEENYALAYEYAKAAVLVDPYTADYYSHAAACALLCGDMEGVALYIDNGLFVDPEHEGINAVYGILLDSMGVE